LLCQGSPLSAEKSGNFFVQGKVREFCWQSGKTGHDYPCCASVVCCCCKRKALSELDQQIAARKRAAEQIKLMEAKKAKLMIEASNEARKVDSEITELQKLKK